MTDKRSHPAVLAGLLGGAASWGTPTLALASPIDDAAQAISSSLLLQFVVGCAAGAAIASAISVVVEHFSHDEVEVEEPKAETPSESEQDDRWSSSSLNLMRAMAQAEEEDPTGDLGRVRTGQVTIDFPVQKAEPVAQKRSKKPQHFARPASAPMASKSTGRHFASGARTTDSLVAAVLGTVEPSSQLRGRHFAGQVSLDEKREVKVEMTEHKAEPQAPIANPTVAEKPSVSSSESARRERLAQLPVIGPDYEKVASATIASDSNELPVIKATQPKQSAPHDSSQEKASGSAHQHSDAGITARLRLRRRDGSPRRGVRQVLAERLERNALDGVPIIQRADGSVGDVTPTWFDQTVVPALASLTGVGQKLEDTAARAQEPSERNPKISDEPSRATYISKHVAEVDLGMFPERRSVDELERGDVWEEALAAMGETIEENTPSYARQEIPVIGKGSPPSTTWWVDLHHRRSRGPGGPTGFIPFRVPAAHPEVVDTETYVDYLLRDELSRQQLHEPATVHARATCA